MDYDYDYDGNLKNHGQWIMIMIKWFYNVQFVQMIQLHARCDDSRINIFITLKHVLLQILLPRDILENWKVVLHVMPQHEKQNICKLL